MAGAEEERVLIIYRARNAISIVALVYPDPAEFTSVEAPRTVSNTKTLEINGFEPTSSSDAPG